MICTAVFVRKTVYEQKQEGHDDDPYAHWINVVFYMK